jgi:hypothetical protein
MDVELRRNSRNLHSTQLYETIRSSSVQGVRHYIGSIAFDKSKQFKNQ